MRADGRRVSRVTFAVIQYRGKYLLNRHAKRGDWSFVGGHVEPGETHRDALVREISEEIPNSVGLPGSVAFSPRIRCSWRTPETIYFASFFAANVMVLNWMGMRRSAARNPRLLLPSEDFKLFSARDMMKASEPCRVYMSRLGL